ncbi:MAG: hypothetical protein KDB80_03510, partial [Planctomycetes bacterium]|nr:hypothetical protein [Planctomycetota bacterium]
ELDGMRPGMRVELELVTGARAITGKIRRVGRDAVADFSTNPLAANLGGPIPIRASANGRTRPRSPLYEVDVELDRDDLPLGATGVVRVELDSAPLLVQTWRRLTEALRRETLL